MMGSLERLWVRETASWRTRATKAAVLGASLMICWTASAQEARGGGPQGPSPLSVTKGKEYVLEQWADGVYLATGGTGSQNCVVVGDKNVLLYDVGTTPAGARALLEDVKLVTDKPVRTVVNSHFHYDHVFGNGAFAPDVQIIGHTYTRTALVTFDTLHREPFLSWSSRTSATRVETLRQQVATETDPQRRTTLEAQLTSTLRDLERAKEISPIPPNVTFDRKMVLDMGGREIQLLYLGRGHTAGDVVLLLPKERIVCSGDLMEGVIPYMGDGFFDEWVKTLEALKQLEFDTCLPGHGRPFTDKARITHLQDYLTDVINQVARIRAKGIPAEQALEHVDLNAHERNWPPRLRPLDIRGMRRVYEWLEERAAR